MRTFSKRNISDDEFCAAYGKRYGMFLTEKIIRKYLKKRGDDDSYMSRITDEDILKYHEISPENLEELKSEIEAEKSGEERRTLRDTES